jgi:hypothetical protein
VTEQLPSEAIQERRPVVRPGYLWAGGVATAIVAGLVAWVGSVVSHVIFGVQLLPASDSGVIGLPGAGSYPLGAVLLGLLITAVAHLLLAFVPQPIRFFDWLMALLTVLAVVAPFAISSGMNRIIATAIVDGLVMLTIWVLLLSVARRARVSSGPANRSRVS